MSNERELAEVEPVKKRKLAEVEPGKEQKKKLAKAEPDEDKKRQFKDLVEKLKHLLKRDNEEFHRTPNPSDQLRKFGVFAQSIKVLPGELDNLWHCTADALAETFPAVPGPIIDDLRQGTTTSFQNFWNSKSVKDSTMALVTWGAPFPYPMQKPAISAQQHLNKRVFWFNPISAVSSHLPYLYLKEMQDLFTSLSEPGSRLFVSGDSVKLCASRGPPTPAHSDEPKVGALPRTQIAVMFQEPGASTLMAVPASEEARKIMDQILKLHPGFSTVKFPELKTIFEDNAVGIEAETAVLGWAAGTIHFEKKGKGRVTRFFCGVQTIEDRRLTPDLLDELITLAFLRQHGIDMASFNRKINGESLLFVNGKSTQSYLNTQGVDPRVVKMLKTPLADMKEYLRTLSPELLALHGLKSTNL